MKFKNCFKIIILSALTLDGKMNLSKNSTSKYFDDIIPIEAFKPQKFYRSICDAILVGSNTIKVDNPRLLSDKNKILKRIVISRKLDLPLESNIFQINPHNTIIITTKDAYKNKKYYVRICKKRGVNFVLIDSKKIDFFKLFQRLSKMYNFKRILVEGGGRLIYFLLKAKMVSYINTLLIPYITGNKKAVSFSEGNGFRIFKTKMVRLKLKKVEILNKDYLFLKYEVKYD